MNRIAAVALLLFAVLAADARAHGTTLDPASRVYACRYIDPDVPPCAKAYRTRPQAIYDWMAVLIGDAAGRHRRRIPDGELCSAGDPKFAALDAATTRWPATGLEPGPQTWKWVLNAPHATRYYRFYITRNGYDPTRPLRWSDLELIHDSGPRDAAALERFKVDVPARTGRHVVYSIWQRSDSPEAFYACSDVVFGAEGDLPADPPLPDEGLAPPPVQGDGHADHHGGTGGTGGGGGKPTRKGIRLRTEVDEDWGAGYCATVRVVNRSRRKRTWKGSIPFTDTVTGLWNARHRVAGGRLYARGEDFNATLSPKGRTTFGFCATR